MKVGAEREAADIGDLNSRIGEQSDCQNVGKFGKDAVHNYGNQLIEIFSLD